MDALNKTRQSIVNTITAEAIEEVEKNFPIDSNKVLVIGKEGWNARCYWNCCFKVSGKVLPAHNCL